MSWPCNNGSPQLNPSNLPVGFHYPWTLKRVRKKDECLKPKLSDVRDLMQRELPGDISQGAQEASQRGNVTVDDQELSYDRPGTPVRLIVRGLSQTPK
ncbi:hypothetical protein Nepgr_027308 [Nepenthes gracilis]|uniref:Uncharacterized protein n=1 Tax=Nepenthes gracilis TaxID=150966 RepID=A0AAD3T9N6_NEPGR|nr:hypothetical protein Nepgr_027308 [Nepenthes gracilis]